MENNKTNSHDNNHNSQNLRTIQPPEETTSEYAHLGTVFVMQTDLFELGRKHAGKHGTKAPVAEQVDALENNARGMARDVHREAFDPAKRPDDAMHMEEFNRDRNLREDAENGEAHATANLRDEEMNLAKTPRAGPQPKVNPWLILSFVIAITITCSPTLHDFVFHTMADDLLAWFSSSASSVFVALMLTLAILGGKKASIVGAVAGIILGVGLGAVRMSSAEGWSEIVFAIGLTVVEIAAVLLLEWVASGHRRAIEHWEQLKTAEDEAVNRHGATQADLVRWQARVKELNDKIAHKIAHVEDVQRRNISLPELEAIAVKAVHDGYFFGIAENVGRLHAAVRRVS